jgi:hypothetical protein
MLKITDLTASKELESKEMAGVRGGTSPFAIIDFSTGITNKVADVTQVFGFAFAQGNEGTVTNNQAIAGGNGLSLAPVSQYQDQYNDMHVYDIGNVSVS